MENLTAPRVALYGFTLGATLALGWMTVIAARTAWAITRGHRWYQVRALAGRG